MSRIKGKNTLPELTVRRLAHKLGYRFRLHVRQLSGSPDLVFPSRRKVIFVHGCFWHGHPGCRAATIPSTRPEFWRNKINATKDRDRRALRDLAITGWDILVVWECELRLLPDVAVRIVRFLGPTPREGTSRRRPNQ